MTFSGQGSSVSKTYLSSYVVMVQLHRTKQSNRIPNPEAFCMLHVHMPSLNCQFVTCIHFHLLSKSLRLSSFEYFLLHCYTTVFVTQYHFTYSIRDYFLLDLYLSSHPRYRDLVLISSEYLVTADVLSYNAAAARAIAATKPAPAPAGSVGAAALKVFVV